jgi:hypothetical protein
MEKSAMTGHHKWCNIKKKKEEDKTKRFQFQPWYVKLWRRRWLFLVPFEAVWIWLRNRDSDLWFIDCWSIAHGSAHLPWRMNWVHDWDEVKLRIEEALASRDAESPVDTSAEEIDHQGDLNDSRRVDK